MGVFQQFPYTNFHEMNLDEIIRIVKQLADDWVQYQQQWGQLYEDTEQALQDFKDYAQNYFDTLDLQDEVNTKINEMLTDGTFDALIVQDLSPVISAWLADHITQPTTPAVDTSLTVAGAAADAKVVGDEFSNVKGAINAFIPHILEDYYPNNIVNGYYINYSTGNLASAPSWSFFDSFKVLPGTKIRFGNFSNNTSSVAGIAFYTHDNGFGFISGAVYDSITEQEITVPDGANYACLSVESAIIDRFYYGYEMQGVLNNILADIDLLELKTEDLEHGRNMFDPDARTPERYLSNSGVPTFSGSYFVTDFIPVTAGEQYIITPRFNVWFYDENKTPDSSIATTVFIPESNGYIRATFANENLDSAMILNMGYYPEYQTFGYKIRKPQLNYIPAESDPDNLFNPEYMQHGYLGSDGTVSFNSNYYATQFLAVIPDEIYTISNLWGSVHLYKADGTHSRGIQSVGLNDTFITFKPVGDETLIRFTVYTDILNTAKFEKNIGYSKYTKAGCDVVDPNRLIGETYKTTHVHVGSGCYFTTISDANDAITDSSFDNRYVIHIMPGTYNETFRTKDFVDYVGFNKHQCIINYISDDESDYLHRSTIFAETNSRIANLTVRTTGSKYPIHSDARYGYPYIVNIENCIIAHDGFTDTSIAPGGTGIGIGLHFEQYVNVSECIVSGTPNVFGVAAIYCHNDDQNQSNPVSKRHRGLNIKNSILKDAYYGLRLDAVETVDGQDNDCIYIGNVNTCNTPFYIQNGTFNSWHVFATMNDPDYT